MLVPIQKLYWDEFFSVVKKTSEILARDIADSLALPAKPLLNAIRENTIGVYIFDEANNTEIDVETMRCCDLIDSLDSPLVRIPCMNPVLWSSTPGVSNTKCLEHIHSVQKDSNNLSEGKYIKLPCGEIGILYDKSVYTKDMKLIGQYNKSLNIVYKFKQNIKTK